MEIQLVRSSLPQQQLPAALQLQVLLLLPPNERALSGRLVSPDARYALSGPQNCTVSLSQPLPAHSAPCAQAAGQQHLRQLPFRHKLQLLCTAAASGSVVNLEVVLALLRPNIFPEVLQQRRELSGYPDPGVAAVAAGHPPMLSWLLCHCPGLVEPVPTLQAAAWHCDLAGLQAAWAALHQGPNNIPALKRSDSVLCAAAESPTPDAVAKIEWVLAEGGDSCSLTESTAAAAVRSGDLGRLRWRRDRGCPMTGEDPNVDPPLVEWALELASLEVAQWLVDEAGCALLPPEGDSMDAQEAWVILMEASACGCDALAKLRWLQQRGAPPIGAHLWAGLAGLNIGTGHLDLARYRLSAVGPGWLSSPGVAKMSVASGKPAVLELLHRAGLTFNHTAYNTAAGDGGLEVVRYLACEAGVSAAGVQLPLFILHWPKGTPAHSRDLLEAVQLLVGAGCTGWDAEKALKFAAERGNLALVQYLLQQQPAHRPSWGVLLKATSGGFEALLEWLAVQHPGCVKSEYGSPYTSPACHGDLGTLAALRRLGVPWGTPHMVATAVQLGCVSLPVLRWLVEQGAPPGSERELLAACGVAWEGAWTDR